MFINGSTWWIRLCLLAASNESRLAQCSEAWSGRENRWLLAFGVSFPTTLLWAPMRCDEQELTATVANH